MNIEQRAADLRKCNLSHAEALAQAKQEAKHHTPGPWKVCYEDRNTMYGADGVTMIAKLYSHDDGDYGGTVRPNYCADFALIAAAPDLLAALELIVRNDDGSSLAQIYCGIARDAINKAKGETK